MVPVVPVFPANTNSAKCLENGGNVTHTQEGQTSPCKLFTDGAEICSGVETVEEVEMAEIGPVSPIHHCTTSYLHSFTVRR